jgi:hypothetical protein
VYEIKSKKESVSFRLRPFGHEFEISTWSFLMGKLDLDK